MHWRPSLAEFLAPFFQPAPWTISLGTLNRGIDNAHIDCLLSPRFREQARATLGRLIREASSGLSRRVPEQLVGTEDLAAFRDAYVWMVESALERPPGKDLRDTLVLLQFALIKFLLQGAAQGIQSIQDEIKARLQSAPDPDSLDRVTLHEQVALLTREAPAIHRRVLQLLFRQIRRVEIQQRRGARAAVPDTQWPVTEAILFNPILLIADPGKERALTADYPIGWLAEAGVGDYLALIASCLTETFAPWLPEWLVAPGSRQPAGPGHPRPAERRDQGLLRGFVATEILLDRFVPRLEYSQGLSSWLDEPANLRLFLDSVPTGVPASPNDGVQASATPWHHPDWPRFQRELVERLHARLDSLGLLQVLAIVSALPKFRAQMGHPVPLALVIDYAGGRLSRRGLEQRVAALRSGLDPVAVQRVLDGFLSPRKGPAQGQTDDLLGRYLVDFLSLRRDLKLAYKTYEVLDGIRVVESEDEARLSRTNRSLYEFPSQGETGYQTHRVRAHAVLKADVRGSTRITEELRARGLNPASHFSLNFFGPVNQLLPEFRAEKLFVEGDAVILALYEFQDEGAGLVVARACRLAHKILQVVTLQNARNRQHGLPELELGLGISFARREPNFLYDEGRPIMISDAINRADRLSSSSGLLRRRGFAPANPAFRVAVVRDLVGGARAGPGRDLLTYNVNGVKLDDAAFLKLEEEIPMTQVRLPDREAPGSLFLLGSYADDDGCIHWIVLRHAPVCDWDGDLTGPVEPERRHYFEMIVDEPLAARLRRLAAGS